MIPESTATPGRLYSHESGYYWLTPFKVSTFAGRGKPHKVNYKCEIRRLPCWPVAIHPQRCGEIVGYSEPRPSPDLAIAAGEVRVREMYTVPEPAHAS